MEILYYSAISLLAIKYFSPIQPLREWVVDRVIQVMIKLKWFWLHHVVQVLACPFCFAFWLSLGLTLNLGKAAVTAMLTMVVMYVIETLLKYLSDDKSE